MKYLSKSIPGGMIPLLAAIEKLIGQFEEFLVLIINKLNPR